MGDNNGRNDSTKVNNPNSLNCIFCANNIVAKNEHSIEKAMTIKVLLK